MKQDIKKILLYKNFSIQFYTYGQYWFKITLDDFVQDLQFLLNSFKQIHLAIS